MTFFRSGTTLIAKALSNLRVFSTYLSLTKTELAKRIKKSEKDLTLRINNPPLSELLFQTLHAFVNSTPEERSITYRDVLYMKSLVKKLEQLDAPQKVTDTYTALDELLIYLNFNHKPYLNYFTHHLAENINAMNSLAEKLDFLLYYYKAFRQLHRKPHIVFNPKFKDVKDVLNNWFEQEIRYLKQKQRLSVTPLGIKQEKAVPKEKQAHEKQKITCQLSSDQLALILRSLDDLRIISARSLNDVFRTIVPYLSTPYKQELSFEAMRSKSYTAETRDQKIAIETLEQMIKRIKEY